MSRKNLSKILTHALLLVLAVGVFSSFASASPTSPFALGYLSWDLLDDGFGRFDITNMTGPNSSPNGDDTFPVATGVNLAPVSLVVTLTSGGPTSYGPSYFTLNPSDSMSWDGTPIYVGGGVAPTSATLTGTLSPTFVVMNDGSSWTLDSSFYVVPATIGDGVNPMNDGDLGIIYANGTSNSAPEPSSFLLLGVGMAGLLVFRSKLAPAGRSAN